MSFVQQGAWMASGQRHIYDLCRETKDMIEWTKQDWLCIVRLMAKYVI